MFSSGGSFINLADKIKEKVDWDRYEVFRKGAGGGGGVHRLIKG